MSRTRRTDRRNNPEGSARVVAASVVHDGRLDWRKLEFLGERLRNDRPESDVFPVRRQGVRDSRFFDIRDSAAPADERAKVERDPMSGVVDTDWLARAAPHARRVEYRHTRKVR